jgi:1-acyl-sn-glycerol-3-phosphate acyltransferase
MPDAWYTFLSLLCSRAYFSRIRLIGAGHLPSGGPILYTGLHRNGAVDGFVYKTIFPRTVFLISTQLRKNLFSRMFFTGIAVVREKDSGDRGMNSKAMERCADLLAEGGELFVFPEGTSSLGPRHLPFRSGAARMAAEAWKNGVPLTVIPVGITYDAPATFRSSVEVIIGDAIPAEQHAQILEADLVAEAKKDISRALENVGINVESEKYFEELRMIGRIASPGGSYFRTMKICEKAIPEALRAPWAELQEAVRLADNVKQSEAARAFKVTSPWVSLLAGMVLAPFVAMAAAFNFLPLGGAYWASKKFADGPNVITLWRMLIGAPLLILWFVAVFAGSVIAGTTPWYLLYLLLTLAGWLAYQPMRQYLIAGHNGIRFPKLRRRYLKFQKLLSQELGKHEF